MVLRRYAILNKKGMFFHVHINGINMYFFICKEENTCQTNRSFQF